MEWLIAADRASEGQAQQALATIMSPQTAIGAADLRQAPEGGETAYGMGFVITNFAGGRLLSHGGGGRGWRHLIALLPERQLGVPLRVAAESPHVAGFARDPRARMAGLPCRPGADRFSAHP